MAINYASKYSPLVDERFKLGLQTGGAVNQQYDWIGVDTVNVYSIPTAAMNDYNRSGSQRYGTPGEMQNNVQTMKLNMDRSFSFTIDKGNYEETMMTHDSGQALRRQIDEVVIPEIDEYRLAAMEAGAGTVSAPTPITATNAYEAFLNADVALTEAKAPPMNRIAFVSPNYYKFIKLDNAFIKQGDVSQGMVINGVIGMVDNTMIVRVPTAYLPVNTEFIMTHPVATVAPQKLAEYKIHDNPPGINGWLVEGRVLYGAFVLDNKATAIYVHKNA